MIGEEIGSCDPERQPPLPAAPRVTMLVLAYDETARDMRSIAAEPARYARIEAHHCIRADVTAQAISDELAIPHRSEEHTSELQSLMRISYAVFSLKKKNKAQTRKQQEAHN